MKQYSPSHPQPQTRPPPRSRSIPPFHAVPGKARADGWTPLRQAEFIGHLAETRSVSAAAQRVGMARETAYRLRRRKWSASFCAAWDAAVGDAAAQRLKMRDEGAIQVPLCAREAKHRAILAATGWVSWAGLRGRPSARREETSRSGTLPREKVTLAELEWRYSSGIWHIIMRRGRYYGVRRKPDDSALLQAVGRLGITSRRGVQAGGAGQRSQF